MPKQKNAKRSNPLLKKGVYLEQQWEDILQRKGWGVDISASEAASWEDTIYANKQFPSTTVLIHEGKDQSFFAVMCRGSQIERSTNPETLWDLLEKAPLMEPQVVHDKELNEDDIAELKAMGIKASKNGEHYDYEIDGDNIVLIAPMAGDQYTTIVLEDDDSILFMQQLGDLDAKYAEQDWDENFHDAYRREIDKLVAAFMQKQVKTAYVIRVKPEKAKTAMYVSGVNYEPDGVAVAKFTFTADLSKAQRFRRITAHHTRRQIRDNFKMEASTVEVKGLKTPRK
jgi:hypothetical protein